MSFFDAPWHIMILLVVVLLLFGSSRLPGAAQALGRSMHIFKASVKGEEPSDGTTVSQSAAVPPAAQLTSQPADRSAQAQIEDLQRQVQELQRQAAGGAADAAGPAKPQQNQQPL